MKLESNAAKAVVFIVLIILSFLAIPILIKYYDNIQTLLQAHHAAAPLIYMLLMIIAILIVPLPASPLAITAGLVFGPWPALLYTLIAATLGAVIAFSLARFFLRGYLYQKLKSNAFYKKIQGQEPGKIAYLVAVTRLMPQVSFDLVSYAAGLTSISVSAFAIATFFGMIPIVFILTFFGYLLQPYETIALAIITVLFLLYLVHHFIKKKY